MRSIAKGDLELHHSDKILLIIELKSLFIEHLILP